MFSFFRLKFSAHFVQVQALKFPIYANKNLFYMFFLFEEPINFYECGLKEILLFLLTDLFKFNKLLFYIF